VKIEEIRGLKTVSPIPLCCGSCRYHGTIKGAFCSYHLHPTFAMGICRNYEPSDEYRHLIAVEAETEPCEHYIEPNFCGAKDGKRSV